MLTSYRHLKFICSAENYWSNVFFNVYKRFFFIFVTFFTFLTFLLFFWEHFFIYDMFLSWFSDRQNRLGAYRAPCNLSTAWFIPSGECFFLSQVKADMYCSAMLDYSVVGMLVGIQIESRVYVQMSVNNSRVLCKNGQLHRDAVLGGGSGDPKERCIKWVHSRSPYPLPSGKNGTAKSNIYRRRDLFPN